MAQPSKKIKKIIQMRETNLPAHGLMRDPNEP